MALRDDLQIQLDLEHLRNTNQLRAENNRNRLEAVRLAKEILVENARNKPVDESTVSADDVITFADKLITYINA